METLEEHNRRTPANDGMKDPVFSIIIPLWNREVLVEKTLASLQAQTFKHWEAIVVDDGSTDDSYQVVEKMAALDPRVRCFKRASSNKGANVCRNEGVQHANGTYIIFLDSDDIFDKIGLAERYNAIQEHPELDFWVFDSIRFNDHIPSDKVNSDLVKERDNFAYFSTGKPAWITANPVWLKTFLTHDRPFDENLLCWQDWEFHMRMLSISDRYHVFHERGYVYYRNSGKENPTIGSKSESTPFVKSTVEACQNAFEAVQKSGKITPEIKHNFYKLFRHRALKLGVRWQFSDAWRVVDYMVINNLIRPKSGVALKVYCVLAGAKFVRHIFKPAYKRK